MNLNQKNVVDTKKIWKGNQINFLIEKILITLVDNEKIITNGKVIAIFLHDFFSNVVKTLNMPKKIILTQ